MAGAIDEAAGYAYVRAAAHNHRVFKTLVSRVEHSPRLFVRGWTCHLEHTERDLRALASHMLTERVFCVIRDLEIFFRLLVQICVRDIFLRQRVQTCVRYLLKTPRSETCLR